MDQREIDSLIRDLSFDELRNCSIISFVRENPVLGIERAGSSVLVRGRSDRIWTYVSSADPEELERLAGGLSKTDEYFGAIEPWMVPTLRRDRAVAWELPMLRFFLPAGKTLPEAEVEVEPLSPDDAATVFRHSDYAEFISEEYSRSRIVAGPAVGIRKDGALVAWGMTQDDGAMGFLHVIERCRNRGYGRCITIALARELRRRGRLPYAYISSTNAPSIALVETLGFEPGGMVLWFRLE